MIIVASIIIIVAVSLLVYTLDDYGEYNFLKPGFFGWIGMLLGEIVDTLTDVAEEMVFWLPGGRKLYHPDHRPEGFFREGEEVYFFNIQKTLPHYNRSMGLVVKDMPEGRHAGRVLRVNKSGDGDIVTVDIDGRELPIYDYSVLLMHTWEFTLLKRNPLLKKFYCINLIDTDKNFKKSLKVSPLH